jgi:MFS family permease
MGDSTAAISAKSSRPPFSWLWDRQLHRYPDTGPRYFYLGISVLLTITLYYELYVQGAVAPSIIADFHMSFPFFIYIVVISNAVGAFASLIAGLADRWGRANLVTYGLAVTGLLVLFGLPNAPDKYSYGVLLSAVAFVEGIMLVATPALVRDFSPQIGRASAMGFWTMGPVIGSLVVTEVSSHTLSHLTAWQDQFVIAGIVGMAVFAIALVGLRELSPSLRDQLMVSLRDRALLEARAQGIDIEAGLQRPWRQMLHFDVISPALGISVFLIVYYTLIALGVVYFVTIFGFTQQQANSLGNWVWAFDAGALVVVGIISDWLRVRKPLMVVGALGAIAMMVIFARYTYDTHTGYYSFVWNLSLLAVFLGVTYAPWMAAFTETVERRNPALIATGLAVWGWIIRAVVSISIYALTFVVTSMTPLVENGPVALRAEQLVRSDPALAIVVAHQEIFNRLGPYKCGPSPGPVPSDLLQQAIREVGLANLNKVNQDPRICQETAFLKAHQREILAAQRASSISPSEWRRWWWVSTGGMVAFLPLVLVLAGRWSPRRARQDQLEHEQRVQRELEALLASRQAPAT